MWKLRDKDLGDSREEFANTLEDLDLRKIEEELQIIWDNRPWNEIIWNWKITEFGQAKIDDKTPKFTFANSQTLEPGPIEGQLNP